MPENALIQFSCIRPFSGAHLSLRSRAPYIPRMSMLVLVTRCTVSLPKTLLIDASLLGTKPWPCM